jgi:prevent-host-death family protein
MVRVTAAQLQKQFGAYSEQAQREPVTITKHGRDSLVLVDSETFEQMRKAYYAPKAYYVSEAPEEFIRALETAKAPESSAAFNHELDEEK